jgi:alpha-L-arabinofuranosidase
VGRALPRALQKFIEQIRAKYPNIKICGSSGPSADGKDFDYGWEQMRKLNVDLVDEHYYKSPQWFLDNAARYDNYSRKGPKVFAGEYAAHGKGSHNNWEAALSEAAFMTGLERNADVVLQATYAPLFAHVEGWQWRPDLIWFDNLSSVRSANWYVQMLYGTQGTNVLPLTENASGDGRRPHATACLDKPARAISSRWPTRPTSPSSSAHFNGVKSLKAGKAITMQSSDAQAENTLQNKNVIVPVTTDVTAEGNVLRVTIPAKAFVVYRF